jgi:tRNA nucleotidyltransferase/poly(A) polymerase
MSTSLWLPDRLAKVLAKVAQGRTIWLVGGAVRDARLGRPILDYDFAVADGARLLARKVANALDANYYDLDKDRDTGRVVLDQTKGLGHTLDFAALRGETIEADLRDRDFTVNALAVSLEQPDRVLDPTGGLQDLEDGVLRACGPGAVAQDPVRALRGVRIATELGLRMKAKTRRQVIRAGQRLEGVSAERVRDEVMLILGHPQPAQALRWLDDLGLLAAVFPELEALKGWLPDATVPGDAWQHTLSVVDWMGKLLEVLSPEQDLSAVSEPALGEAARRLDRFRQLLRDYLQQCPGYQRTVQMLLYFAALYHETGGLGSSVLDLAEEDRTFSREEIGSRVAERRARWLRLSNAEVGRMGRIVRFHRRPERWEAKPEITARDTYRYFRDAGAAGVEGVLLWLATLLGKSGGHPPQQAWTTRVGIAKALLEAYSEGWVKSQALPPLVRGDEIAQALGLQPGPVLGRLMALVQEAQVIGEVKSREQALAFARRLLEQDTDLDTASWEGD